jgi:guanylate kinase
MRHFFLKRDNHKAQQSSSSNLRLAKKKDENCSKLQQILQQKRRVVAANRKCHNVLSNKDLSKNINSHFHQLLSSSSFHSEQGK